MYLRIYIIGVTNLPAKKKLILAFILFIPVFFMLIPFDI